MTIEPDLFASDAPAPVPGFTLVERAVEPDLEADLAARIDAAPLVPFQFGQWQGKRLTAHYGSAYDYQHGRVTGAPPLPAWLVELRARLAPMTGLEPDALRQALLLRYDPGAGIGWHRDRPQYGDVLGLSLGAPAVLRLRRRLEGHFERRRVLLPPRSVYRLSGEVRWDWEHSIVPGEATRRSITFRSLRSGEAV